MARISYIIPVYNEALGLGHLFEMLKSVAQTLAYDTEFIFVNDGSTDQSGALLADLAARDARVKVIEFTRNFGKEIALTAGLETATGDACLMLDADMQHPIERIPDFVRAWEAGAKVVTGIRAKSAYTSVAHRVASRVFYTLMRFAADTPLTPNATDFRLLDREVVSVFLTCREKHRITRGLIEWLGFPTTHIEFVSPPRRTGHASYGWLKRFKLASSALVAHSLFPLKVAGYLGAFIVAVSLPLGLFILIEKYFLGDPWGLNITGTAMLAVFNLFLVGIVLICLGLMALYVAAIHTEVANRPLYVVREKRNC